MKSRNRKTFEDRFGTPFEKWNKAQMKEALIELLPPLKKRGRPATAQNLDSQTTNHNALTFWVGERLKESEGSDIPLTLKEAVRQEMHASVEAHNADLAEINSRSALTSAPMERARPVGAHHVESKLPNAYREVLRHRDTGI